MESGQNREFSPVAMEHGRNPRHFGAIESFDAHACIKGPCGDTVQFWLQIGGGRIEQVSFCTDGCCASRACGSMTAYLSSGKTLEGAAALTGEKVLEALGRFPEDHKHCAVLAVNTLRAAIENYRIRNNRKEIP